MFFAPSAQPRRVAPLLCAAFASFSSFASFAGCDVPVPDDDNDDDDIPVVVDPAAFTLPADAFSCRGSLTCFFVDVPVDPDVPDGETLTIQAGILPARSETPLGVLAINFGGFGAPGLDILPGFVELIPELREHYHLVTWDPRGGGGSTPLTCAADFAGVMATSGPATTLEEAEAHIAARRALIDDCRATHGGLVDHMGFRAHAQDLDAVRAALGVERWSYLGYSGGTSLGQAYAEFYPERLKRTVWDSAIVAHGGTRVFAAYQAPEGAVALNDFAAFCDATACGFDDPIAVVEDVLAAADAGELLRADGTPLTWLDAAYGVALPLYAPGSFPVLVDALRDAQAGDGAFLQQLSNAYLATTTPGTASPASLIYFFTNCAEELAPTTAQDYLDKSQAYSVFSALGPVYATDHAWCAALGDAQEPLGGPMTAADVEEPIFILQSTRDIATPLAAGQEVRANIANARLVIHDGAGHTPSTFNRCMAGVVNDYFVRGIVPADNTHCAEE